MNGASSIAPPALPSLPLAECRDLPDTATTGA